MCRATLTLSLTLALVSGCAHADPAPDTSPPASLAADPAPAASPLQTAPADPKTSNSNTPVIINKARMNPPAAALDSAALMAKGRADVALFYGSDVAAFYAQLSPLVKGQAAVDQIKAANAQVKASLGGEKSMVSESMTTMAGMATYRRVFVSAMSADPLDFNVILDAQGLIMGYNVRPHAASAVPGR